MSNPANTEPLQPCCAEARRSRLLALFGPASEPSLFDPMLYDLISRYAPNRLYEIHQTLFGALSKDEPFWGIYEKRACPVCGRELHVLFIDAQMIVVIDQLTRQLYDLVETASDDDLSFIKATGEQRARAREILSQTVFRTGKSPMIQTVPPPGQLPQAWLTEAMKLAYAFMVVHETSHQGPQAALGDSHIMLQIGAAHSGAALYGITLSPNQAISWAKELAADSNAFLIMVADSRSSGLRDEIKDSWYRALIAGVALALKAWDLMLDEFCYGNAHLSRGLLRTHPPARWRIECLERNSQVARRFGLISGDRTWADRVMDALDDLYQPEKGNAT